MHYSTEDMISIMSRYFVATSTDDLTDDQIKELKSISYVRDPGIVSDEMWENADNLLTKMGF